jgi:hypothetical protein
VTWNPSDKSASITLSNGNLTATANASTDGGVRATTSQGSGSGKYYFEITLGNTYAGSDTSFGVCTASASLTSVGNPGLNAIVVAPGGALFYNGSLLSSINIGALGNNYTIGVAVDLVNFQVWMRRTIDTTWNGSNPANDPAANVGGVDVSSVFTGNAAYPVFASNFSGTSVTANFGGSSFVGTVPSGFVPWDAVYTPPPPPGNKGGGAGALGLGQLSNSKSNGNNGNGKGGKPGPVNWNPYRTSHTTVAERNWDRPRRLVFAPPSTGGTIYNSSIAFIAIAGSSALNQANLVGSALFNAIVTETASGGLVINPAITLAALAGLASSNQLTLNLSATLGATVAQAAGSELDAVAALTFNAVEGVASLNQASQNVSVAFNAINGITNSFGSIYPASIALNASLGAGASGSVTLEGTISLGSIAALTPQSDADLTVPLSFAVTLGANLATQLDAQNAINLAAHLAALFHIASREQIADLVELQGIFNTAATISGTFDTAITVSGTLAEIVELAGIKNIDTDLDGMFEITITLDGRTLN